MASVMEELGPEVLRAKGGADPTGVPFDSVSVREDLRQSPLVNAGAMASVSLVPAANAEDHWAKILAFQSRMPGRRIDLSNEVNRSGQTFHNRAIAWLLYCAGTPYSDPMEAYDVYTRQCCTLITTIDLAAIRATLDSGGVHPLTGERVIKARNVPCIFAEITMEGLDERSGDWGSRSAFRARAAAGVS